MDRDRARRSSSVVQPNLSRCGGITEALRLASLDADGAVATLEGPGLGVEVDEDFVRAHPVAEGSAWR